VIGHALVVDGGYAVHCPRTRRGRGLGLPGARKIRR
jgi:hypothetical protein